MADVLLQAWWVLVQNKAFGDTLPPEAERRDGWRKAINGRSVEMGWLARSSARRARYGVLTLADVGL